MQRSQDQRTNLGDLKGHIVKKVGVERSRRYFNQLGRFLSHKLTKSDFDKTCLRLLGRENLSLHNQLIRSILRNATVAKSPPPVQQAGPGSLMPNHNQNDSVWSNGVLPISPRKVRSGIRERKMKDRPSPLGSNGKVEHMLHQPICREDNRNSIGMENGDLGRSDYRRSCRYATDLGQVATASTRDKENHEEQARLNLSSSPLTAPLGIPYCSASLGGSLRTVPVSATAGLISCYNSCGLPDTEMLRKRMENIAIAHGLGGVSTECANTLNNMLDLYLKKLIKSCIDLVGSRSTSGYPNVPSDIPRDHRSVSLLDFRIAMELNPHQLGENWPILRESISMRSFEDV